MLLLMRFDGVVTDQNETCSDMLGTAQQYARHKCTRNSANPVLWITSLNQARPRENYSI